MFKKDKTEKKTTRDDVETIIGPSVKIEGDFKSSGNIMVAGVISGTFTTSQNLRIEENAKINADINAREAIIAGVVKGNVLIKGHLEVLASAQISGDIKTGSIAIQQGAKLNGNCSMETEHTEEPVENIQEDSIETAIKDDNLQSAEEWGEEHPQV